MALASCASAATNTDDNFMVPDEYVTEFDNLNVPTSPNTWLVAAWPGARRARVGSSPDAEPLRRGDAAVATDPPVADLDDPVAGLCHRRVVGDQEQCRVAAVVQITYSRRMTASPVAPSRLPVGSSASRRLGSPAKARASATRCCSPPESWAG